MKNGNNNTKKYVCYYIIYSTLLFIISAFVILRFRSYLLNMVLLFMDILLLLAISKNLKRKYFFSPLYTELNAEKFADIVYSSNKVVVSAFYQLLAAYHSGDYQTAVNICARKLTQCKNKKEIYVYLTYWASVCFELGDTENLAVVCQKYDKNISQGKNAEKVRKKHPLMEFYRYYLKHDYDKCKSLLADNERSTKKIPRVYKIQKMFNLAVISYKCGDIFSAKELFENIVRKAPKLNYSTLSKLYLGEIGGGTKFDTVVIIPENDYSIPHEDRVRRIKKIKVVLSVFLLIYSSFFVFYSVFNLVVKEAWENGLEKALSHFYEDYQSYKYFLVPHGDGINEQVCIVVHDNQIDVLINETNYKNKMNTLYMEWQDITEKYSYRVKSAVDEHYFICRLFSNQKDIPDPNLYVAEIKINDQVKWLCFEYVVD